jgi:3-methyladenine DNA glycosylase/8-oxoguanine DNA glycosylase
MPTLSLPARPPFQFRSVVHSHGWYQLAPFAWDEEAETLSVITRLDHGRVTALAVRAEGEGVVVEYRPRLNRRDTEELAGRVQRMLMLDADFAEFYRLVAGEPRLAHIRARASGRMLRSPTLFEDVVKVMLTTNIQWAGTKRLAVALVDHFGERCDGKDGRRAFPTADRIARSRESALRKLGLGYRSPYLLALAREVASGRVNLETMTAPARATEDVRRDLLALPGIGPYAAATLLSLVGRYDYIGVDSEALSSVSQHFYEGGPIGAKDVNAVFEKWGKYKALAYWFWDFDGQQQLPMEAWEARQSGG